jgi:predicted Rossmann fold flavoprotein
VDVLIVGGGAAGLATAIFTRRDAPHLRVRILERARRPGAKILVSGGSRCNVTNRVVTERDFSGGSPAIIRRVLRALPVPETIRFFADLGVPLHEEAHGKLFPDSNRSRDVLDALLGGLAGAELIAGVRVLDITRAGAGFEVTTSGGTHHAHTVVLATGGLALPKSGSDGAGLGMAQRLGHALVPTTPALAPLRLDADAGSPHLALQGLTHDAVLTLSLDGRAARQSAGSLLWTHFGISGPAPLDMSRHWLRARVEGRAARLSLNVAGGRAFEAVDAHWIEAARSHPRQSLGAALGRELPGSLAAVLLRRLDVDERVPLAALSRASRRRLVHELTDWQLPVTDSRGYTFAEATACGVPLDEIDPATMQSRRCPGLFLVGEVLDVDGRLGGFNFQWAWASARAAARGLRLAGRDERDR